MIRDQGSANGIYVNGRKVEKSPLRPGDTVRLGEVQLRLLPEIGETVVMAPEGLDLDALGGGPVELGESGPRPLPPAAPAVLTPAPAPPPGPRCAPPVGPAARRGRPRAPRAARHGRPR